MERLVEGQHIVLREVVKGRIWIERPARVMANEPPELVIACPAGSTLTFPAGLTDRRSFLDLWNRGEWELTTRVFQPPTTFRILGLSRPFDVWFYFTPNGAASDWYINLQEPIKLVDNIIITSDWILDLTVSADLERISIKDVDELASAEALGVFPRQQVRQIREAAAAITSRLNFGDPPWGVEWPVRISALLPKVYEQGGTCGD